VVFPEESCGCPKLVRSLGLAVVTLIPVFKALKVADRMAPLFARALTVAARNPKAIKWLGAALKKTVDLALAGKFDRLLQVAPFVLIGAQLSEDEEVLEFLLSDIQSTDDVFAMLEFFTFPAEGWDGIGPPPSITLPLGGLLSSTGQDAIEIGASQIVATRLSPVFDSEIFEVVSSTGLIESAHAGAAKKVGLLPASIISGIRGALQKLPASSLRNARQGRGAFRAVVGAAHNTQSALVRKWLASPKMIFNGRMLARVSVIGSNGLKKILTGWRDARVPMPLFVAGIAYIEVNMSEREIDGDAIETYQDPFDRLLRKELNRKYVGITAALGRLGEETFFSLDTELAQIEAGNVSMPQIVASGHGDIFHLMMLAYYMALEEGGGATVKGIEMRRSVWLFGSANRRRDNFNDGKTHARFTRRVDIVLGEKAVTSNEDWIELKSYSAKHSNAQPRYTPAVGLGKVWTLAKGSRGKTSALHRQFVVDRIAEQHGGLVWVSEYGRLGLTAPGLHSNRAVNVTSMLWWFQKFERKVKRRNSNVIEKVVRSVDIGGPRAQGSILHLFKQLPLGDNKLIRHNVQNDNAKILFSVRARAKAAAPAKLFLNAATTVGKDVLIDAALDDPDILELGF
jgi:hypothetical protein